MNVSISLEDAADYLESATIEHSHDIGHAIVHIGVNRFGKRFVLTNDCLGESRVTEAG